jgi:hypothetical protein
MKKKVSIVILSIFLLLQLVPIDRTMQKEEAPIQADSEVVNILKRSCFDCHSNQTQWPVYSYVFPISLIIKNHIEEGKTELNFSTWESLSLKKKATIVSSILEEVEEGEMPLFGYTILHRQARLSDADFHVLKTWANKIETAYQEEE